VFNDEGGSMARKAAVGTVVVFLAVAAVASAVSVTGGSLLLGPATHVSERAWAGYYDGHKDTYLITDVSSKAQAQALHVNYSAALAHSRGLPAQYFVSGRAAAGQIAVFGSEPGEHDYNPLWEEIFVTWDPGVTPKVLTSDNEINAMAAKHKLTVKDSHIVLNAPITSVGK
jgi:hypothetical protein